MPASKSFWTRKRLRELLSLNKTKTHQELSAHFQRPLTDIIRAIHYAQNIRKLKPQKTTEIINGKRVTVWVISAEYAGGTSPAPSCYRKLALL